MAEQEAKQVTDAAPELTLKEVQSWKGHKLDEIGGANVGRVEGVYVDSKGGEPEWLQARMGRFGHYCLVPAREAVGAIGHVWVPYSRDQIRQAPRVDPGKPLTRDEERKLLEHYGVGTGGTGRGSALDGRAGDETTAQPAG